MNDVYLRRAARHAKPNVRSATLIRNLDMSSSREEYGGRMMWLLHVLHVTNRLRYEGGRGRGRDEKASCDVDKRARGSAR